MKYIIRYSVVFALLISFALAQETPSNEAGNSQEVTTSQETQESQVTAKPNRGNFAISYSTNYPFGLLGITLKAGLTDRVAAEVTLAPIDLGGSSYSVKGSYEFIQDTNVRVHVFGVLGIADGDYEPGFQARGLLVWALVPSIHFSMRWVHLHLTTCSIFGQV
jgi:hypothetical protein